MRILVTAVLCAVICITSIAFCIDAIRKKLDTTSAIMIGGDRVISASIELDPKFKELMTANQLRFSEIVTFYSMLSNGQEILLSSVKAVDQNYPLLGDVKISPALNQPGIINNQAPAIGEIWLESRAILQLGAKVGDRIQVGDTELRIGAILSAEPDRLADGFTFAPRAMMNLYDVAKTKSVIPGSRVSFKLLAVGSHENLLRFDSELSQQQLGEYTVRTIDSSTNSERNLNLAENYLNLALIINLILAAITVMIAANRYSTVHTIDAAILRCVGASKRQILYIYSSNLVIVSVIIGLLGSAIGFGIESTIEHGLFKYMNLELVTPGLWPLWLGLGCSLVLVLLFALPAILKLANTSPMQILHRASNSSKNTSIRLHLNLSNKLPALLRLSLNNIAYNTQQNLLQVTTFALIICVGIVLFVVRADLLKNWQGEISGNVPNYFAINIPQDSIKAYEDYLSEHNIISSEYYPMVRGELMKINNEAVTSETQNGVREGIHRNLNLTWTENLPFENKILAGKWFQQDEYGQALLSIENEMAARLKVHIGDTMTFKIMGDEVVAKVSNIRSVAWGSFTPNFYVIYNPGLLADMPVTYMGSFYMTAEQATLLPDMVKRFPQINLINVDVMLDQAQMVISLLSLVVAFIWIFTLSIGILLLLAILLSGMNLRIYQNNLMRIFGASRRQLLGIFIIEYTLLGAIAGFIGAIVAILIAQQVSMRYFSLYYPLNWYVVLWAVISGITIMLLGGILGANRIFNTAPIQTLRNLD